MYSKCECPYCEKTFFNDTKFHTVDKKTGSVTDEVEVYDTLTEEEMRIIVLKFIITCLNEGVKLKDLNERVIHCLNVSPQFINEFIEEVFSELECKMKV